MMRIKKIIFVAVALFSFSGLALTGCASSGGMGGGAGGSTEDTVRDSASPAAIGTYGSMDTGAASGARPDVGPGSTSDLDRSGSTINSDTVNQ